MAANEQLSAKASSVSRQAFGGTISVYLEDDRVEIGSTSQICQETLARVAYRDVRRIVSWPDQRRAYMWTGCALMALSLAGVIGVLAVPDDVRPFVALLLVFFVPGVMCMIAGRPGAITRVRIEGVRGSVDAILAGRAKKRARVLEDLERRVRNRQSAR